MAQYTAEARRHFITKSTSEYQVTLRTLNVQTGEQSTQLFSARGEYENTIAMCANISARHSTQDIVVVPIPVGDVKRIDTRFAVYDDVFAVIGHVYQEGEKLKDCMVRTLKCNVLNTLCANFKTREFTERKVVVIGEFDNADDALAWYVKRNPESDRAYITTGFACDTSDIKYVVSVKEFFEHAFPVDTQEAKQEA